MEHIAPMCLFWSTAGTLPSTVCDRHGDGGRIYADHGTCLGKWRKVIQNSAGVPIENKVNTDKLTRRISTLSGGWEARSTMSPDLGLIDRALRGYRTTS